MSSSFDCLAGCVVRLFAQNQALAARIEKLEAAPRRKTKPKTKAAEVVTQVTTPSAVGAAEGRTQDEIAKTLDVPQKTVSNVLDRLSQNGGTAEMAKPAPPVAPTPPQPEKPRHTRPRPEGSPHPLRAWRQAHGTSLQRVAEFVEVTSATISRVETGEQYPRPDLLARLVELTSLDADDFLTWFAAAGPAK